MSKLNVLYGSITGLIAVAFFLYTFSFPSEQRGLDPRLYPRFISICFFALSVGLIITGVQAWRKERKPAGEKPEQASIGPAGKKFFLSPTKKRIGWMFLVALGYVAIIDTVGYLVATPPFLAGSMVLFGEKRVLRILLVSVISTAILFWLFRIIFRVPLPVSSLW
ncbi:MAG: tripartite tricarboxylate transporter TctB family protein [Spirochaetes bacterium]|nr:tripartite tricarboxylate transporter TctB family protein [Spirochaetota bacterium]